MQYDRRKVRGPTEEILRARRDSSREPTSRVDSFPSTIAEDQCDACEKQDADLAYCNICNINYCPTCWPLQATHRRQRLAPGKAKHEKTELALARKIRNVLLPTNNIQTLTQLHEDDAQTAWFGIERPQGGEVPIFKDYGRYDYLLSTTVEEWKVKGAQSGRDGRTPSLVSFVGQSGAGKSSLIKLLIDLRLTGDDAWPTPVVGGTGVIEPTSEDVHLYADPVTAITEAPIFFADCEGLSGGEREPISAKFRRQLKQTNGANANLPQPISERELGWADTNSLRSREFAVTNLYPRLLYTFSDVIVFVLKNPRVIESVLEQLVTWAAAALEMSSNQPVLPHVIIALNASDLDIDELQWDPDIATASVLGSLSRTVFKNAVFKKYAQFWRERQRQIETVEQLIQSYYTTIRVVRIPTRERPPLVQVQIRSLHANITVACEMARDRKTELRMLLDAEELQSYLQCAFDHFAASLDRPFDFVQASFSNSPIPLDFGGNILKLAIRIMHVWRNKADAQQIFQELSYMVASCIMLDCARQKTRGTATDIFPLYLVHLDAALENFCDGHWPCEYVQLVTDLRCVNVKSGHGSKGHQTANGNIIAVGEYMSRWNYETLHEEFINNSYYRLEELLERLKRNKAPGDDEMQVAADIHRDDVMTWFYSHVAGDDKSQGYVSHSVCFCCLSEPPEHSLPCGHVLCTPCVKTYGWHHSKTEVDMQKCPLDIRAARAYQPWRIHFKPESAGVRILTLDGGGIRGIVELEILQGIETALGGQLRIQHLIDLIVGTSTGGLVALGLASRNWTVETCINKFKELCDKAFTRRFGSNMPLIGWFVDNINHSKYETTPLQEALQNAFTEDQYLFGGQRLDQNWTSPVKVAVTTTSSSSSPVVLANYNRRCEGKLSYQFQRPESVKNELKTWEAARATSAAPRYFRPYLHESSKQIYMDGALYHNNPIRIADAEWKLIWSRGPITHPDLMLSLGTGLAADQDERSLKSPISKRGLIRNGKMLLKIATDHIADALDCEKAWDDYVRPLILQDSSSRFVRYNVEIDGELPSLDDVKSLQPLQDKVSRKVSQDPRITNIAFQLVATCFYFDVERIQQFVQNSAVASGRLYCRFADGSLEMQELGRLIRTQSYRDKNPLFLVREKGMHGKIESRELSPDIVGSMISQGKFPMRKMNIQLRNKLSDVEIYFFLNDAQQHSISGFPRCLFSDGNDKAKTLHPQAINTRRWAGRSNSRNYQRTLWIPPSKSKISRRGSISHYSDPSHVMGYATQEQMEKTAEALSQGSYSSINLAYKSSSATITPEVSELDSTSKSPKFPVTIIPGIWEMRGEPRRLPELDGSDAPLASSSSAQTRGSSSSARLNQSNNASNTSLSVVSVVDPLYADPRDQASRRTDSVVDATASDVSDQQTILPGDTESETAVARRNELAHSSSEVAPTAHNHITTHDEDYVAFTCPRREPRDLMEEEVYRKRTTRLVVPVQKTQPEVTAAISASVEQDTAEATSIVVPPTPSPEIVPIQRVPSLPHTLPPLDAFEAVSFSITMPGSAPTDSPVPPSNDPDTNNQWRWDIQF